LGLRVSIVALIAAGIAGCSSDATRFNESPFSSPYAARRGSPEVTGSISRGPAAPTGRVESRPLPQTYQPAALPPPPARNPSATGAGYGPAYGNNPAYGNGPSYGSGGTASGAGGMGSYRPPHASPEVTGSIAPTHAPTPSPTYVPVAPPPPRAAAAEPRQHGGRTVVTVVPGDTVASYSRRYGVSMGAIIRANNLASPNSLTVGQQIVIPGEGRASAAPAPAPAPTRQAHAAPASVPAAPSYGGFHVAGPGDTLSKIARRYRVSVVDLARANKLSPHAQVKLGDRLAIPSSTSRQAQAAPPRTQPAAPQPTPQAAAPAPRQQVAQAEPKHTPAPAEPRHSANLASPTQNPEVEDKDASGAVFRWPVRGRIVTAFGAKPSGQQNDGINIAVPEGTPIKAAEAGEVAYAGNELKGYGNLILVRHPNGFVTAYAHASELLVKRGDKVRRGQVIAKSGRTGAVSAPQLHFEIRKGSTPVDPSPYLGA
jgi:murein DD-endopeptidase MepM/ murein hydrolase activator NlpD